MRATPSALRRACGLKPRRKPPRRSKSACGKRPDLRHDRHLIRQVSWRAMRPPRIVNTSANGRSIASPEAGIAPCSPTRSPV